MQRNGQEVGKVLRTEEPQENNHHLRKRKKEAVTGQKEGVV